MAKPKQLKLFDFTPEYSCPLCGEVKTLFGQYSSLFQWGVCRECSIANPYPVELFVPSTRRNADKEPLMIDPDASHELRERRILLDEQLRCAVDPARIQRPVVKYNLSGLELRYPILRSKMRKYQGWSKSTGISLKHRQMSLPVRSRCGCAHNRRYDMAGGHTDYWDTCQQCADELQIDALWRHKGVFGGDDAESVMDRLYMAFPELFERGALPDYWFQLMRDSA